MDSNESKQEAVQHEGCGCGGCSATGGNDNVEKVDSYESAVSRRAYTPAVDIVDNKEKTVLVMDLPGAAEGVVDISVEKNILTIKAQQGDLEFDGKQLVYAEYGIGDYQRSFVLSDEIDKDGIKAGFKDGVLTLTLPKTSPVSKKIAVGS